MTSPGSAARRKSGTPTGPALSILSLVGAGRTSRVWLARLGAPFDGLTAGTEVAVKILLPELAREPDALATLAAERAASRSVHHPALARARFHSAAGPTPPWAGDPAAQGREFATRDCGVLRPWLMLDYVPGSSLEEWIEREGAVPEPIARRLGTRLARALSAMHAAGWVHGDVKPENVRLDAEGHAVLVDLGFARRAGSREAPLGTLGYLAPERQVGGPPASSADLFALGCLLFEAVTGRAIATNEAELEALRTGRSRAPSEDLPRVSPLFDGLVRSLLQVSVAARPTALEASQVLEEGEASSWWREQIVYGPGARRDTIAWAGEHRLPLAGRDKELDGLHKAWAEARKGGVCVLLTGPQGAGKSRLVSDFVHLLRQSEEPPLYLYGRCNAIGDERPGAPLIALLRRWMHLPSGTRAGLRVTELLEETVPPGVARTLLAAVRPDRDDGESAEMTDAAALAAWMLALPKAAPTILFLDDVHFAGSTTLAALQLVARELERSGMLLILGLRSQAEIQRAPGLAELRARLAPITRRVDLAPLNESQVLGLVERLFHSSAPRLRLARVLTDRTGGLPGSIAELLRLAGQRGWTRPSRSAEGGLELLIEPETFPRPQSVQNAVAERLDELPGRSRIWLERFAVLGSRFDLETMDAAWPRASVASRDTALAELVRDEWLITAGNSFRFSRPIEREEVLERTSPNRVRRHHLSVADALRVLENRIGRSPSYRRAFHLREGGDDRSLLEVLPGLLHRMRDNGHPNRRATLASWGLETLEELGSEGRHHPLRRVLLESLADAADRVGARDDQRAALEELGELDLDLEGEPAAAARVYLLHARHTISRGRFGLARGFLRNAEQLADRAVDSLVKETARLSPQEGIQLHDDRAEIARLTARIAVERGDYAEAKSAAKRALTFGHDPASRAEARLLSVEVLIQEGDLDAALKGLASARRELRRHGGRLRESSVRATLNLVSGRAWRLVGRPARAARAFERAQELAAQTGHGTIEVEVSARRGRLYADVAREREGELMLRDALFTARRIEDGRGEALAALFLAILLGEQETDGASRLVARARSLSRELGLLRVEALAGAIEARVARAGGDGPGALEKAASAWSLVERHGAELPDRIVIGGTLALVRSENGEGAAAETLEESLRRRIEKDNTRLAPGTTRRRHARWTLALLQTSLSPDGPLYPRVSLPEWVS